MPDQHHHAILANPVRASDSQDLPEGHANHLPLHPLCKLFPRLVGTEFEALKADIKANGLRHAIVTHKGMILDGGNRYAACMEVGIKPLMTEYTGANLDTYVLSANFYRRHLSAGQHATIVSCATNWAAAQMHGGDRKSDQGATLHLETVKARAARAGASVRTQKMADKVSKVAPALATKVAHGEISLPKAAQQVKPTLQVTPKKPAKPEPAADPAIAHQLEDARKAIEMLAEDNDRLADRLAVAAMDASQEEKAAAKQTIEDLRELVRALEIELDAVKSSRDSFMRECNELKSQCARQRALLHVLKPAAKP